MLSGDGGSRCLVCGSAALREVGRLAEGPVWRCRDCRLEMTGRVLESGRPASAAGSPAFSTVTSPDYTAAMVGRCFSLRDLIRERASNRLRLYSELLGRRPARILEVGSGNGGFVKAFQDLGLASEGLEIDETLVSLARAQGADIRLADISRIDPRGFEKYDVVFSSQTLEHILTPRAAMRNMRELTREGGLIHIDVPNSASWGARYHRLRRGRARWAMLEPPHHQIGYHPASLARLFEDSGLRILKLFERPTDDPTFGQTILPTAFLPKIAISLSRLLGHGYLLVGLAGVPSRQVS